MLGLNLDTFAGTGLNENPHHKRHDHSHYLNRALTMFHKALTRGVVSRLVCFFTRKSRALIDLDSWMATGPHSCHYAGIQAVHLDQVCGSMGRTSDFDCYFNPLNERTRDRWVNIAIARLQNIPLDPVELVEVNGRYFVQDGHHRISVARAMGQVCVDAMVIVREALPVTQKAPQRPVVRVMQALFSHAG